MIPIIAALVMAASPLDPITIHGLRVIPPVGLAGEPSLTAIQEDLDNDGRAELLFDDHLLRWPYGPEQQVQFPDHADGTRFDVFRKSLYAITADTLNLYSLGSEKQWKQENSWSIAHPSGGSSLQDTANTRDMYLFDTDNDGSPELIHLAESGIWVLSKSDSGAYSATTPLMEWPATHAGPARDQVLWPMSLRRFRMPEQTGSHRVLLEGSGLSIVSRVMTANSDVVYSITQAIWSDTSLESNRKTFPALDAHTQPIRLNQDDTIDLVSGRWYTAESSALPIPIYECAVSLDGGMTFERRRVRGLRQGGTRTNFIDIDNDGDHDWIMTEPDTFDRGQRDAMSQFLTRDTLRLRIQIFLQDAGKFSKEANLTTTVLIDLGKPPVRGGAQFQRYLTNQIYSLTGDVNGDGWKDLIVRTQEHELAVYPAEDGDYSPDPHFTLSLDEEEECTIIDIDQDGFGDLVRTLATDKEVITQAHFLEGRWP